MDLTQSHEVVDEAEIANDLMRDHFVIARGAIAPRLVQRLKELCGLFYGAVRLVQNGAEFPPALFDFSFELREQMSRNVIMLQEVPGSIALLQSVLERSKIPMILKNYCEIGAYDMNFSYEILRQSYVRCVDPSDHPAPRWHQDRHATTGRVLTLWMPLTPCGVDAPSLQFLPAEASNALDLSAAERNMENYTFLDEETLRRIFPATDFYRTSFSPGDVAIFDGSVIHGTHYPQTATASRLSLDIRLECRSNP